MTVKLSIGFMQQTLKFTCELKIVTKQKKVLKSFIFRIKNFV